MLALLLLLAFLQPVACHLVQSDWIRGRNLAEAVPALAALPPDVPIVLSPLPGQQRSFRIPDLRRIAVANHLDAAIGEEACFEWRVSVPDQLAMKAAMMTTLADRNPAIEIIESSLLPGPEGKMVFPLTSLTPGSDKPSMWKGYIQYGERKQFPVWARVRVTVKEQHVVAGSDLHAGDFLEPDQVKTEPYEGPVRHERYLLASTQAIGMLLRCPVSAGAPLLENMLEAPREVNRGDVVDAIVQTGGARLDVRAVAEASGRRGQIISVRNPRSGRSFHGRVTEKGTVEVVSGGQFGLVVESKKS